MKLEQLLASKGYTQQEITDLAPLLANSKFRASLEEELAEGVKAKTDLDEYDRWFTQEITPEHQALLKRTADAEADAAGAKARFEAYQKSGMYRQGGDAAKKAADDAEAAADAARKAAGGGGVDTSKFVDRDTFNGAFSQTGNAIATAVNISTQHMQLFPGQYLDMEQLLNEAKAAKKPVKDYWENKYQVAAKREDITKAARQKEIDEAVKKREVELMAQFGGGSNPNMQIGVQSNNPFVIKKQNTETKQPWEKTPNEVSRDRVQTAIEKAAARGDLARA